MKKINIMPMAGRGVRFRENNYITHKPLIMIKRTPMFVNAAKCMPSADKWLFIYKPLKHKKIYLKSRLSNKIKKKSKIIYLKKDTLGQADTCFKASKFLNSNASIFVHSCDSYISYNKKKYNKLINLNDVIIFTTKPNKYHLNNHNSFGWVNGKEDKILNIECKKIASKNYTKDFVIVGSFGFKNKKIFINGIKSLYEKKMRVNNEYYLDMVIKELFKSGLKVYNFIVDDYFSWGTPDELNNYLKK